MVKVAFMYDFDDTLIDGTSEMAITKNVLGISTPNDWWAKVNAFGAKHNMDPILATLYCFKTELEKKGIKVTREFFNSYGKTVKFFEGVTTWFDRINAYAKTLNIEIDHYVISSGLREIMEATEIAPHLKKIFGCCYVYDESGNAIWPAHSVNYTNKTQFMYRIRKGFTENLSDFGDVNEYIKDKSKVIPYERMVYFGDGITDVPCMKILTMYNGNSVCVYKENNEKSKKEARKLYLDRRVNSYAPADYRDGSQLDHIAKHILRKIASYIDEPEK